MNKEALERWKVGTLAVGVAACLSNVPTFQRPSFWAPEARVLITDFSFINGVAATPFTVFAATPFALLRWDRLTRRFALPVTTLEGYPTWPVQAVLADATDDAVWLATGDGWARYDARLRQWQSGTVIGGVTSLALDQDDPLAGIYLRVGQGWTFLPRGALQPTGVRPLPPRVSRPLDYRAAMAQLPQADVLRALMLTDARLRSYQITSAATSPDQSEVFLGTTGLGVIRVEGVGTRWEVLNYGLPGAGATALAAGPDGVWLGVISRSVEREGLAWVASDLSATRWIGGEGRAATSPTTIRRLLARAGRLWAATQQGLVRVDPATERVETFAVEDPRSLAPAPDGVWVGTRRGLMHVTDSGAVTALGVSDAVISLLPAGDSLWVGTATGLSLLVPGANATRRPAELATVPGLNAPIVGLARVRDTVIAATPDQLAWRTPAGVWTLVRPAADLGRITTLASDREEGGVWIGGERGAALWRTRGDTRALRVPADLPAGVYDMLVAPPYLWVATERGVVRFLREAAIAR